MSVPAGVSIRTMTISDVPAGLRLCRASGWNQTARDWNHFLTFVQDGALVAVEGNVVIGTVATLPYGPFTWISMVLVDEAARGRGIGRLLLTRGLALVPAGSVARLDATPAGEVIYRKLGFVPEYALTRLFLDAVPQGVTWRSGARPVENGDWAAILEMDLLAFGASRARLLQRLAADAPDYAWVVEEHGRLRGYALGRHGHVREQIGPVVADTAEIAHTLIEGVLARQRDRPVFIDVPDDHREFRDHLAMLGFRPERSLQRMHLGRLTSWGEPELVYAIGGPELG